MVRSVYAADAKRAKDRKLALRDKKIEILEAEVLRMREVARKLRTCLEDLYNTVNDGESIRSSEWDDVFCILKSTHRDIFGVKG